MIDKNIRAHDPYLASQIERAANSMVLNIAEGSADHSDMEFARFLGISLRSIYEVVPGFDLALLYGMISADVNDHVESKAVELIKQ